MDTKIKYFIIGKHKRISIFSYNSYKPFISELFEEANSSEEADIIVISNLVDIQDVPDDIEKVYLVCEEPIWQIFANYFTKDFDSSETTQILEVKNRLVTIVNLSYITSKIFSYAKIPYFITTNKNYISHYKKMLDQSNDIGIDKIITSFTERQYEISGIFQRRISKFLEHDFSASYLSLSNFRTKLADIVVDNFTDTIFIGNGWPLPQLNTTIYDDQSWASAQWHIEKLEWVSTNAKILFSIENSLCEGYVTEKLLDSVFSNCIPIYCIDENEYFYNKVSGINLQDFDLEKIINDPAFIKNILANKCDIQGILSTNLEFANKYYDELENSLDVEMQKRADCLFECVVLNI